MNHRRILLSIFYITGQILLCIQAQENLYNASVRFITDDYSRDYADYNSQDYPNVDYYNDDREGRNLGSDYNDPSTNNAENHSHKYSVDDFLMKQLRSTIPGTPGVDYGLYQSVPDTSFRCHMQKSPGFYGDIEAQCQVFHVCQEDDRQDSFLCPVGTVFNQMTFICDWWYNFRCEDTHSHYHLNNRFHSSSGSTSMKDTVNKMRHFQDKTNVRKMIGLGRAHSKFLRNSHNKRNIDVEKITMVPKIRNLFMLGMRMDKFGNVKDKTTSESVQDYFVATTAHHNGFRATKEAMPIEEDVTVSTSSVEIKSAELEGDIDNVTKTKINEHFTIPNNITIRNDISIIYTTKQTSADDYITKPVTSTETLSDSLSELNDSISNINNSMISFLEYMPSSNSLNHNSQNEQVGTILLFNNPLKSLLNFTGLEMIINGGIVTKFKLDHHNVPIPIAETAAADYDLYTNRQLNTTVTQTMITNKNEIKENDYLEKKHDNKSSHDASAFQRNTSISQKMRIPDFENTTTSDVANPLEKLMDIPTPFSHENNYTIGNDTHVSVSVTIHSNSGRSRLQWKRLPGLEQIREIRLRGLKGSSHIRSNSVNETNFRKRIFEGKPKSRIMWIPAKNNVLERRHDWRSYIVSNTHETTEKMMIIPSTDNVLQNAAVESQVVEPVNMAKFIQKRENISNSNLKEPLIKRASIEYILTTDSKITNKPEIIEMEMTVENVTELKYIQTGAENTTVHFNAETGMVGVIADLWKDKNASTETECKTICIKLLKSLNRNASIHDVRNVTKFVKHPDSLPQFDYETVEQDSNSKFNRESVLGVSPSEQWMVKYDPGPNCNENTDDDKVLVKGWSVIIDTGSVTKEKTVKRRGCSDTLKDSKFVVMKNFNIDSDSKNNGITFHGITGANQNIKVDGKSMDQRYWLNLVRNWLQNSSSNLNPENKPIKQIVPESFAKDHRMADEFSRSEDYERRDYKQHFKNINMNDFLIRNIRHNLPMNKRALQKPVISQIQNITVDVLADLQTERSEWFQATHRDWSNKMFPRNSPTDWTSDFINRKEKKKVNNRRWNSKPRQDDEPEDEDWHSERRSNNNWDKSIDNREWRSLSNKQQWSEGFFKDQKIYPTRSDNRDWFPNTSRNINTSVNNTNNGVGEGSWAKMASRMADWSSGTSKSRNDGRLKRKDANPRQQKRGGTNLKSLWRTEGTQDELHNHKRDSIDLKRHRSSSNNGNKGKTLNDEWNWALNKGYDLNIGSAKSVRNSEDKIRPLSKKNNKGDSSNFKRMNRRVWSSITPRNVDRRSKARNPTNYDDNIYLTSKKRPVSSFRSKSDQFPLPKSRDESIDWSFNDPIDDDQDYDIDWPHKNKQNDEWKADINRNKGRSSRNSNDWSSESNIDWNSETDKTDNAYRGNDKINKNSRNKYDQSSDVGTNRWRVNEDENDWNSQRRGILNNKGKHYSQIQPSLPDRFWRHDEINKKWSKSSDDDRSIASYHSSTRKNNHKSTFQPNFRRPSISTTGDELWDTINKDDWSNDESDWKEDLRDRRMHKGNSDDYPSSKGDVSQWKFDYFDDPDRTSGTNNGKSIPDDEPWNSNSKSFRGDSRNNNDWKSGKKIQTNWPSQPKPLPNKPFSRDSRKGESKPVPSGGWNKGTSTTHRNSQPHDVSTKGKNKGTWDSRKPTVNINRDTWKSHKGNARNSGGVPSIKNSDKSRRNISWGDNSNETKNSSNSKKMKKIIWSVQIGSDGKLSNGWIPITLRPVLKRRINVTGINNNDKRWMLNDKDWSEAKSSTDKDWPKRIPSADEEWFEGTAEGNWPMKNPPKDEENMSIDGGWLKGNTMEYKDSADGSTMKNENWSLSSNKNQKWEDDSSDFKESNPVRIPDTVTEVIPSTSQMPEASVNHPFYISASNNRIKRDYKSSKNSRGQDRNFDHKSYKVIKSGEILNDAIPDHHNNFFLARADIIVEDNHAVDKNNNIVYFNLRKPLDQQTSANSAQNFKSTTNNAIMQRTGNSHSIRFHHDTTSIEKNWDAHPKESALKEKWSSPFYSPNYSASGWIPVSNFKNIEKKERNFKNTEKKERNLKNDLSMLNQTKLFIILNATNDKTRKKNEKIGSRLLDYLVPKTKPKYSENLNLEDTKLVEGIRSASDSSSMTQNVDDEEEVQFENRTSRILPFSDRIIRKVSPDISLFPNFENMNLHNAKLSNHSLSESVLNKLRNKTEMKIGNRTLRILSFSDVMKQFKRSGDSLIRHPESSLKAWNTPITFAPTLYSIKLTHPSSINKRKASNSWSFSSENGTKQTWIIVGNENATDKTILSNISDSQRVPYDRSMEGYTETPESNEKNNNIDPSLRTLRDKESGYDLLPKLEHWIEDSNWKPIITTVGRLTPFNRSQSLTKVSTRE